MASERLQHAILLLPLLLMISDVWNAFNPAVSTHRLHQHKKEAAPAAVQNSRAASNNGKQVDSLGGNFHISFCTSCSFKGQALQTKTMLESNFPGAVVTLSNYPPPTYKRMLGKLVPVVQFGGIAVVLAGNQIFPMLGYAAPPAWYNSLRQNTFGAAAGFWLVGNFLNNALMNTGAFEVYYDGDLVFSKLQSNRFPTPDELRQSIGKVFVRKTTEEASYL